jgi:Cu/Ag efflux protein CusF
MRSWRSVAFIAAGIVAAATSVPAQSDGEHISGVLRGVELQESPRHIMVEWNGQFVKQEVSNVTRLVFDRSEAGYFPNPSLNDLKPGMEVHFSFTPGKLDRLHIDVVPADLRPGWPNDTRAASRPSVSAADRAERRELKVRILDIDDRRGEFRADVAGRRETFRVQSKRDMRELEVGDLVVITVETRGGDEVVTDIRSSAVSGRVVRIDKKRREVVINTGGRDETFAVQDKKLLDDVREGDRVRFETEERSSGGRRVIVAIH